jgi:hypothetical protein
MMRDRPGTLAQGLFTFQFLTILSGIQASARWFTHDLTETVV